MSAIIENTLPIGVKQGWQPPLGPIAHSQPKPMERVRELEKELKELRHNVMTLENDNAALRYDLTRKSANLRYDTNGHYLQH